ncbi:hypothetical protein ACFQZZ_01785 [Nocardia sp. GCM10030253]|uniref:hypothetical protein n=1 Tax=Nocardia sp. GCM10030253 TaxID=3273404 RepID=UPI003643E273
MSTKIASALAAIAITLSVGALTAPTASAAPIEPTPTLGGSVALCFNIPLGFFSFSICI